MKSKQAEHRTTADYSRSPCNTADYATHFVIGFVIGFSILFIFYRLPLLCVLGGLIFGVSNMYISAKNAIQKRKLKLRLSFFDLLEAMSVSMRAGSTMHKSLINARTDLSLIYPENSDILTELNVIIGRFNNAVPLSEALSDLAARSELEDIASFAAIYATIEGKSGSADEIIRDTQRIIADKMEIEMEIDTLMTAARTEVNLMLLMPLIILGIIGYAGAGFMDAIYTTGAGRVVATAGLAVFILSYVMARNFSSVRL